MNAWPFGSTGGTTPKERFDRPRAMTLEDIKALIAGTETLPCAADVAPPQRVATGLARILKGGRAE
ncbi:MAG: hypothetical protein J0G28_14480 [Afipia sp.]|nr:hypothetical protein [Afipia sp.]OJW65506.1 MAG: hypothetical protein BGO65_12325 [Afipia sp. 64-13]